MNALGPKLAKEFVKSIGLDQDGAEINVFENVREFGTRASESFTFQLSLPINVDILGTSHPIVRVFQHIQSQILKSPLIQDEVSRDKAKIVELEKEIERLKKFETHYEMEYTLRQGKEQIICVEKKNE